MNRIKFTKMTGAGNDFAVFDGRNGQLPEDRVRFVQQVCRRRVGVGADGVLIVENNHRADFRMVYYNADGSEAEMCGNGGRCISRYAYLKRIAGPKISFETMAGLHRSEIIGGNVKLGMVDPFNARLDFKIPVAGEQIVVSFTNTGVPHVVRFVDDVEPVEVVKIGREIRYHEAFQPAGTNANFVQVLDQDRIKIRTYERGVEDETLACGTGTVAAAVLGGLHGDLSPPVEALTRGGIPLKVHFDIEQGAVKNVFLEGDAVVVYEGELTAEAINSAS